MIPKAATIPLSQSALAVLQSNGLAVPQYDRSSITPGILHIGLGNFHRAHQAAYLDKLFASGAGHDWGILGAGVRPGDVRMRDVLSKQDWLTTLVEMDPSGLKAWVCGSMVDYVEPGAAKLVAALAEPNIRIVSLTITEGGYYLDAITGGFDLGHPEIQYDILHPDAPETVFGILIAGLLKRKKARVEPFTIMSCDNIPGNGHVTQHVMVGLARAMSPELGDWIESSVAFPNGMVDCITPATTDRERQMVAEQFAVEDASPVFCEPFRQWVLEDNFPAGRPALEKVGVQFVEDVAPYELMKLRILNGGHASIAYAGALLGLNFSHEAMEHPLISGFLKKVESEEIIPTVPPPPGIDLNEYLDQVSERFANSALGDGIPRLCLDGSNRQPKFIFPTISDRIKEGASIEGLALEVALWARYCAGQDEMGREIELVDDARDSLRSSALAAKTDPIRFLGQSDIFGPLGDDPIFQKAFSAALNTLWSKGVAKTLEDYIS